MFVSLLHCCCYDTVILKGRYAERGDVSSLSALEKKPKPV